MLLFKLKSTSIYIKHLSTFKFPFFADIYNSFFISISAPYEIKYLNKSKCPFYATRIINVIPLLSYILISTPDNIRYFTISKCPFYRA